MILKCLTGARLETVSVFSTRGGRPPPPVGAMVVVVGVLAVQKGQTIYSVELEAQGDQSYAYLTMEQSM